MNPTHEELATWRIARRGNANPENMTNPLWVWGVENPQSAYKMTETFEADLSDDHDDPYWCFKRFGQTKTVLADGTIVYIAGEHEDHYDPDFFIYNDVVVTSPNGEISIYGYSLSDFPATDFHSATLVGDQIVLIGSLGYPDYRDAAQTQVLILDTKDWSIQHQLTTNSPGWISRHEVVYDTQRKVIRVTNIQKWTEEQDLTDDFSTWELDLSSWNWNCIEVKNWNQYRFSRKDGELNNLCQIRTNHSTQNLGIDLNSIIGEDEYDEETLALIKEGFAIIEKDTKKVLKKAKPELLETLYQPPIPFTQIPRPEVDYDAEDADEQEEIIDKTYPHNHYRIEVNQVQICFIEDMYEVIMRVEGELDIKTTEILLKSTKNNLSKVEGVKYISSQI